MEGSRVQGDRPPERWQQLERLFDEALQRAPGDRAAFLDQACAGTPELRRDVEALLRAEAEAPTFLEGDAASFAAPAFEWIDPGPPDASFRLDDPLSRYRLLGELGRGGMGTVYLAHDERLGRRVALKFLSPHLGMSPESKARFLHEARAAAAIDHVHIATVHEIGETGPAPGEPGGRLFIVMGYYEGQTLKERLKAGPLPIEQALTLAAQVAAGLAAAHRQGVIHRDIKPANLLVTNEDQIKILDFGVAKVRDVSLTSTGARIGTVAYMSPEQARGEAVDHRTDIWSLGIVLYEMLTGERPFGGEYEQAVLYAIEREAPKPLALHRPEAPPALDELLRKALAKRPEDRYESMETLLRALQRVSTPASPLEVPPADPQQEPREPLLPEGERVQATIVASTLGGYIDLVEQLPPGEVEGLGERLRRAATGIVQQHGGIVNAFSGEDLVVVFGIPTLHEDDFVRAVRAMQALHAHVRTVSETVADRTGHALRLHTGIDAGMVVARREERGEQRYRMTGSAVQVATRLALQAAPDEILVSPEGRRRLVPFFETEAAEPVRLKGWAQPITPYRVVAESGLQSRLEAAERATLTAFTGRAKELRSLERALERALDGEGQFVTVVGEAGLGKSRLLYEFRRGLDPGRVTLLQGRCPSYGSATPYLPFIEALRQHLEEPGDHAPEGPAERIAARVRQIDPSLADLIPFYLHLLSVPSEAYPLPESLEGKHLGLAMLQALSALFTLSTRERPLVLLLEDWHWASEASREVLEHLAEMTAAHRLLVVVTYRPAYTHDWSQLAHHTQIRLRPLEAASSVAVVKSVLGADAFPEALGELLHERTGGNPFFLEEISRELREEGTLRVENGRAVLTRSIERLRLPDTVQAVLRTRLHRLDREARAVLRVASVVGRDFGVGVLRHLLPDEPELLPTLERLRAAGLIQQTHVLPEVTYRFNHVLMQDVVYESLLPHQGKALHRRVGEAIESLYADRLEEHLGPLAHHFSRAETWPKAIRYGRAAAQRTRTLGQYPEALATIGQVQRWVKHLPEDPSRKTLLVEVLLEQERLCETLGHRHDQQELIDEVLALLDPAKDPVRAARAYVRQGDLHILRGQYDAAERVLERALQISRALADVELEHSTLRSIGFIRFRQERDEEALAIVEKITAYHRERGDLAQHITDLNSVINILLRQGKHEQAQVYVEEALTLVDKLSPSHRGMVWQEAGDYYRVLGAHEKAIYYYQKMLAGRPDARLKWVFPLMGIGNAYFQQGKVDEALHAYQQAVEWGRESRAADELVMALRGLGGALLALERFAEALPPLQEAAEVCGTLEDHETEALLWRQVATVQEHLGNYAEATALWTKARAFCRQAADGRGEGEALEGLGRTARRQGEPELAMQHFREALDLAEQLDDRARQGELHNTLGILAWNLGRYDEALAHYERALALFRDLGDETHAGLMRSSRGVTLKKLNRHEEAVRCLEEAVAGHRRTGQKLLEAHALAALGDVHFERGQLEAALPCYGASLQLRWDLEDRKGEGWVLHQLARVYAAQQEEARARDSAAQAAHIAEELGDEELLKACQRLLG